MTECCFIIVPCNRQAEVNNLSKVTTLGRAEPECERIWNKLEAQPQPFKPVTLDTFLPSRGLSCLHREMG